MMSEKKKIADFRKKLTNEQIWGLLCLVEDFRENVLRNQKALGICFNNDDIMQSAKLELDELTIKIEELTAEKEEIKTKLSNKIEKNSVLFYENEKLKKDLKKTKDYILNKLVGV
jgi:peptidoglycan hydrolase CwlO-like protein